MSSVLVLTTASTLIGILFVTNLALLLVQISVDIWYPPLYPYRATTLAASLVY